MSVKFKCIQSGNVFEFQLEHDIKTMRSHPEYCEVKEQQVTDTFEEPSTKRVGRPPKYRD